MQQTHITASIIDDSPNKSHRRHMSDKLRAPCRQAKLSMRWPAHYVQQLAAVRPARPIKSQAIQQMFQQSQFQGTAPAPPQTMGWQAEHSPPPAVIGACARHGSWFNPHNNRAPGALPGRSPGPAGQCAMLCLRCPTHAAVSLLPHSYSCAAAVTGRAARRSRCASQPPI